MFTFNLLVDFIWKKKKKRKKVGCDYFPNQECQVPFIPQEIKNINNHYICYLTVAIN